MVMYVTFNEGLAKSVIKKDIQLRIGDKLDPQLEDKIEHVMEVQADSDELELIQKSFGNLPMSNKRVVRYYGDHARFIAGNWNSINK